MTRRKFLATVGLLLCGGCLSDSEQESPTDSEFIITNERDIELEVSIRLKDGESAFAVEGFVLDSGESGRFTAGLYNTSVEGNMSIVAKILSPQQTTYAQDEIPVGVPEYNISIQSDSISVTWAEN
jgi:hypothetical protein